MHNDLYSRKLFHLIAGSIIPLSYLYSGLYEFNAIKLLFPFLFLFIVFEYFRLFNKKFNKFIHRSFDFLFKKGEEVRLSSGLTYILGCFITILYFERNIAITGMFILNIADPLACITGTKLAKIKIINNKTLEGSLVFFLMSIIIILLFFDLRTALICGFFCALTELLIRPPLDDNFLLPPLSALYIFLIQIILI